MNSLQASSLRRTGAKVAGTLVAAGMFLVAHPDLVVQAKQHIMAVYADLLALAGIGAVVWAAIRSHWEHAE